MRDETKAAIHKSPLVVGVDLGGTQLRVAVTRGSTLLSRVGWLTGSDSTPSYIISRISSAVQIALQIANAQLDQIAGIGIGVPGLVDSRTGVVFTLPNMPGWVHVPLRDILEQNLASKIPIFVENDANVAGLGEYVFGAGRGCRDMVYLTISTGIGGCVIANGHIWQGVSGTAGELGHITIDWQGEPCNCGNVGCLERIASGTAIAQHAEKVIDTPEGIELLTFARTKQKQQHDISESEQPPLVNAEVVAQAAHAGVMSAHKIIARAAQGLGTGLVNIIHSFNPEVIVLGGGVTQMGSMLLGPALQIVQERAMKVPRDAVRIVQAQFGEDVGLIGASALVCSYIEIKEMSNF